MINNLDKILLEKKLKEESKDKLCCPECRSDQFIEDKKTAYIICENCGIVTDKSYSNEKEIKKTIHNETISEKVISRRRTCIGYQNQRCYPNDLIYKLKKIDNNLTTSYENNLHNALPIFEGLTSLLNTPNHIKDAARTIYKKVAYNKITKGRSIEKMIVASIYTAYRIDKIEEYTLKELAEIVNKNEITITNAKGLNKAFSALIKEIQRIDPEFTIPIPDPLRILPIKLKEIIKPAENSNFENDEVNSKRISLQKTIEILYNNLNKNKKIKELLEGKSPRGVISALTYIILKNEKSNNKINISNSQKAIAELFNTNAVTLKTRLEELKEYIQDNLLI